MSKDQDLTKVSKIIVVSHRETPWSSMQAHTAYVFVHDKIVSMATSWLGSAEACMVAWSKSGHTNVIYTDVPTFYDGADRLLQGANRAPVTPYKHTGDSTPRHAKAVPPSPMTKDQLARTVRIAAFRTDAVRTYISIALFNGYVVAISGGSSPVTARAAAWKATGLTPVDVFPAECIIEQAVTKLLGISFVSMDVPPSYLKLGQPEAADQESADQYAARLVIGMRLVWFRTKIAGVDQILAIVFRSGVAIASGVGAEIAVAAARAWADSGLNKYIGFTSVPRECWVPDGAKQLMGYGDAQ